MKIIDVEAIWLRVPSINDKCEWGDDALIVKITTDEGIIGWGETDSSPMVIKSIIETPSSHSTCTGLKEILLNKNPLEIQKLCNEMLRAAEYMGRRGALMHAISAIDIALHDIAGQYYSTPVYMLLGGKYKDSISAYGTFIPSDDIEQSKEEANRLVRDGFRTIKFGGNNFGNDPKKDLELTKAIRDVVGDDINMSLDLVGSWQNYSTALDRFKAYEELNIYWLEEPVIQDDLNSYNKLSKQLKVRISGGEGLSTYTEFERFIRLGSPSIIQPDITRCGGIIEMIKISELADRSGVDLVPHGFSTGILLHATMHFLASRPNARLIEYSQSKSRIYNELVKNKMPAEDGQVHLNNDVGLGLQINEDFIKEYRLDFRFT